MIEDELDIQIIMTSLEVLNTENKTLRKQVRLLQKALKLALKKLKMCGYGGNEKEIMEEVEKC